MCVCVHACVRGWVRERGGGASECYTCTHVSGIYCMCKHMYLMLSTYCMCNDLHVCMYSIVHLRLHAHVRFFMLTHAQST